MVGHGQPDQLMFPRETLVPTATFDVAIATLDVTDGADGPELKLPTKTAGVAKLVPTPFVMPE